jgi:hypothetical protein
MIYIYIVFNRLCVMITILKMGEDLSKYKKVDRRVSNDIFSHVRFVFSNTHTHT